MVSPDVTVGRTRQGGREDGTGAGESGREREKEREGERVDRIFRETGCHIHVLTPSWLTNGLLLSQARVTARAWPSRVVFPENRLKRIHVHTRVLACIEHSTPRDEIVSHLQNGV